MREFLLANATDVVSICIAFVLGVIAIYFAGKSYALSKIIADRRANISVKIYGRSIENNFIYVLPFKNNRIVAFPLSIEIDNTGALSAQSIEVFLELPDAIYGRDIARAMSAIAAAKGQVVAQEPGDSKHLTRLYHSVGDIPPDGKYQFNLDLIASEPSYLDVSTSAPTRDGILIDITARVELSWVVRLTITAKDIKAQTSRLEMKFVRDTVANTSELIEIAKSILAGKRDGLRKAPRSFALIGFSKYNDSPFKNFAESQYELHSAVGSTIIALEVNSLKSQHSTREA